MMSLGFAMAGSDLGLMERVGGLEEMARERMQRGFDRIEVLRENEEDVVLGAVRRRASREDRRFKFETEE